MSADHAGSFSQVPMTLFGANSFKTNVDQLASKLGFLGVETSFMLQPGCKSWVC